MICFDFEGKIKKYNSPEEILEDFNPIRLAYYQKRKVGYKALLKTRTYLTLLPQGLSSK